MDEHHFSVKIAVYVSVYAQKCTHAILHVLFLSINKYIYIFFKYFFQMNKISRLSDK